MLQRIVSVLFGTAPHFCGSTIVTCICGRLNPDWYDACDDGEVREALSTAFRKRLDAIFVCCGGGGMLAGIAAYVQRVRPGVMIIGVEAEDAACGGTVVSTSADCVGGWNWHSVW